MNEGSLGNKWHCRVLGWGATVTFTGKASGASMRDKLAAWRYSAGLSTSAQHHLKCMTGSCRDLRGTSSFFMLKLRPLGIYAKRRTDKQRGHSPTASTADVRSLLVPSPRHCPPSTAIRPLPRTAIRRSGRDRRIRLGQLREPPLLHRTLPRSHFPMARTNHRRGVRHEVAPIHRSAQSSYRVAITLRGQRSVEVELRGD